MAGYALVWIYGPDTGFFRKWVDDKRASAQRVLDDEKILAFENKRDRIIAGLNRPDQAKYWDLVNVCKEIEKIGGDSSTFGNPNNDPRLHKLHELMWTFLRLLNIQERIHSFLGDEEEENLPRQIELAQSEVTKLETQQAELRINNNPTVTSRERFLNSRKDRLLVLQKRLERIDQAKNNLALITSEQERLFEQVKLIRSDAVASKHADAFTARIDSSMEHLGEAQELLSQLGDFRDLTSDEVPQTDSRRIGYGAQDSAPYVNEDEVQSRRKRQKATA